MVRRSGWTIDTLRAHLDAVLTEMDRRFAAGLAAQDKAVQIAMIASEKAVVKAEIAAEKRFESVNEFRAQLTDQAATFLARTEYLTAHQSLTEKIGDLAARLERIEGAKTGGRELWGYIVGGAGIILAVAAFVTR
jgi:hypothetical protein